MSLKFWKAPKTERVHRKKFFTVNIVIWFSIFSFIKKNKLQPITNFNTLLDIKVNLSKQSLNFCENLKKKKKVLDGSCNRNDTLNKLRYIRLILWDILLMKNIIFEFSWDTDLGWKLFSFLSFFKFIYVISYFP